MTNSRIEDIAVAAYTIPTVTPESDGTFEWESTTLVAVHAQLGGWAAEGMAYVKMKVGRDASADRQRVAKAREAIGSNCELFVDANGGYTRKLALEQAEIFSSYGVRWFEEPVSSDDLEGLRLI